MIKIQIIKSDGYELDYIEVSIEQAKEIYYELKELFEVEGKCVSAETKKVKEKKNGFNSTKRKRQNA